MFGDLHSGAVLESLLDALESAGLGCTMFIAHPDHRLERVYANEAIARMWGVDRETMRQLPPAALFTSEQRDRLFALWISQTLLSHQGVSWNWRARRGRGRP